MTLPKNASPEARRKKHAADKRYELRLAQRIRNKRLTDNERANPDYYNDIEQRLRKILPGFEIEVGPCETICRWKGEYGNNFVVISETRPGALLKVWELEASPEF
jgi:hypothetical protein